MTDIEMARWIRDRTLTAAAEVIAYHWDEGFAAQNVRGVPAAIIVDPDFTPIRVDRLTEDELNELGFGIWDTDDPLRLIPLWLLPYIADEFEGGCIDGERGTYKRDEIDRDHRGGYIAYGVIPSTES